MFHLCKGALYLEKVIRKVGKQVTTVCQSLVNISMATVMSVVGRTRSIQFSNCRNSAEGFQTNQHQHACETQCLTK